MTPAERQRHEQALDWVRRIHDPTFADWNGHADWLEAEPRNLDAFDAASLLIEDATEELERAPAPALAVNDNGIQPQTPSRIGWRGWWRGGAGLGLAVAASIAGIVALPSLLSSGGQPYSIATGPGEHRTIALADGTTIALNGNSQILLDRVSSRRANLDRGEAFFTVVHDAAHPFEVHAGSATFQDVGTAFDMVRDTRGTEVAVREGAVMYDPAGAALSLDGGQAIRIAANGAVIRNTDVAAIGSWRQGRLLYRDATLPEVAADLARSIGQPVSVDRAVRTRRFSGVIIIDDDHPRMFRRLAAVMNVAILPEKNGWRMASPAR
ncbi:MAG TPA: FecR domain-containing protein [Acetobacteraceae bacterium]|nr:FecR domain-containing protein [Acetobacteraceae bacterium]